VGLGLGVARGVVCLLAYPCIYRIDGAVHAVIGSHRSARADATRATRVLLFRAASGATFARPRCGHFGCGGRWGRPRAGAPVPAAGNAAGWGGWPLLVPAALRRRQRRWGSGGGGPRGTVRARRMGCHEALAVRGIVCFFFFFLVAIATLHLYALRPLAQRGNMR